METSFLQSELVRVSSWIEFADKKAGFLGVFYSAAIGFVLARHNEITQGLSAYTGTCLALYILLLLFLFGSLTVGIYFLFRTVKPRLKNHHTSNSLFYFGNVAQKQMEQFVKGMQDASDEDTKAQLLEQIYTNSVIADKKMASVQHATHTLFVVLVALVIFSILI